MRLIIGPTSAGKSSYIQGLTDEGAAKPKVYFAHQIQKSGNIPTGDNDVVHYNLLHGVKGRREAVRLGESELLHNLIDAASDVVVLSAPRSVLLERSGSRVLAEPDHPGHAKRRYDQELWEKALRAPDLAQVYEHLGLLLDEARASHEYFCTNVDVHGEITPIARWDFPQLARDDAQELCRKGHRLPEQAEQERSYQTDHRIGGVSATLSHALVMPLENKKVLDIGCAEGAVALSAARMGARVTGLEPRQGRLTKARRAAEGMGLDVEFRKGFLDSLESRPGTFDVVLALNVVHHVPNPFAFLDQAASLTRSHLVLEYPGSGGREVPAHPAGRHTRPRRLAPAARGQHPRRGPDLRVHARGPRALLPRHGACLHQAPGGAVPDAQPLALDLLRQGQERRGHADGGDPEEADPAQGRADRRARAAARRDRGQPLLEGDCSDPQGHRQGAPLLDPPPDPTTRRTPCIPLP